MLKRYRVSGVVQGVGFRPFIYRIATEHNLFGWVLNDSEGVLIEVQGTETDIGLFFSDIYAKAPAISIVENVIEVPVEQGFVDYDTFQIKESQKHVEVQTIMPVDTYVCDNCLSELFDKNNKRYRYPFINCTNCGPRYTIIESLPYDRPSTTMSEFEMCSSCLDEYTDVNNRRYHAQPNACPNCGPHVFVTDELGNNIECKDAIEFCIEELLNDKVISIKSNGGFHLVCNALSERAVLKLRERKHRPDKAFAVMVADLTSAKEFAEVNEEEEKLLCGIERPIVLLKKRKEAKIPESLTKVLPSIGIMLPSTPIQHLLFADKRLKMLVMTSGNDSGNPICYTNEDALNSLGNLVDYFLLHNRKIHTRIDDSIVKVLDLNTAVPQIIRRARGFAPYPVLTNHNLKNIFAFGSELKNTISLSKGNKVFISQHLGDLKNDLIFNSLLQTKEHLQTTLSLNDEIWVSDMHPSFRTTKYIDSLSDIDALKVQHHHAHMCSCMLENSILEPSLGIIFDGTGYGLDGTIWGGEFLFGDFEMFNRIGTLSTIHLIGGEKAINEPIRIAFDLLNQLYSHNETNKNVSKLMHELFTIQEIRVFSKMIESKINTFNTSSMGRLFDGISALVNFRRKVSYEGQAAIELEALLNKDNTMVEPYNYSFNTKDSVEKINFLPIVEGVVNDLADQKDFSTISRKFHSTIVCATVDLVNKFNKEYKFNNVVMSGGVFLNDFLTINLFKALEREGYKVNINKQVPTNDGGISFGQIAIANSMLVRGLKKTSNETASVLN